MIRVAGDRNTNVFDECVLPVVESGLAGVVELPHALSPNTTLETASGHTMGHAMLRLRQDPASAYFTGDVFHHPMQIADPEPHLPVFDDLEEAIATRKVLISMFLANGSHVSGSFSSAALRRGRTDVQAHLRPGKSARVN
jgi:glyoxylase-like metal-dependent hydrolase (beta-lactamase superfamily II)